MQHFGPADYRSGAQNWSVVQDQRGILYIGNVDGGVLEFDGVRWRRILVPDMTTVRSLALGEDGRVYVGTVGDFGYLAPDEQGFMRYVSLSDELPTGMRDFADVWNIMVNEAGVYFFTFSRLIRWRDGEFDSWTPQERFHVANQVGERIFVREEGRGLLELVDDRLELMPGGGFFADERVYVTLRSRPGGEESRLLIGTRDRGWFVHDGESLRRWETDAEESINNAALYRAEWLDNGVLAVATLNGGLFLLDQDGNLLKRIGRDQGLPDDGVFAMHEDHQGGLWLALNNGLTRLELGGPLTYFGEQSGLTGIVLAIHQHDGTLYVGTTDGLFRRQPIDDGVVRFELVGDLRGQVWDLIDWNGQILAATMHGVYALADGRLSLIWPTTSVSFALLQSSWDPSRIYIGLMTGIASIRHDNGEWIDEGRIQNTDEEVRNFRQAPDGILWAGTRNSGTLRLRFPEGQASLTPEIERYSLDPDGSDPGQIFVFPFEEDTLFATSQGLYRFDPVSERLVPHDELARLFPDGPRRVEALTRDPSGRTWLYGVNAAREIRETGLIRKDESGAYHWDPSPFGPIDGTSIEALSAPSPGLLWLGGDDGLYRYAVADRTATETPFQALIRRVSEREDDQVFFAGNRSVHDPVFDYADNSIRFEYAATSYDSISANEYRVRLEGLDQSWSGWSRELFRDYTNLSPGDYDFRVQARNVYGSLSEEAVYSFQVLPPWYRTWWAYLLWFIAGTAIIYGAYRWRSTSLRRRNLALERIVEKRTRALSRANEDLASANQALSEQSVTDPLTGLYNRRFLVAHIGNDIAAVKRQYKDLKAGDTDTESDQRDLIFFMIDIDHFKPVNDDHGHAAGDRVLVQMAEVLSEAVRASDIIVRWGGEEFLVVARDSAIDSAPVLAERIRIGVAEHVFDLGEGRTARLSCSIGFAAFPLFADRVDEMDWEDVVNIADQCLYAAKHYWRDAWVGVHALSSPDKNRYPPFAIQLDSLIGAGCLRILTSRGQLSRLSGD